MTKKLMLSLAIILLITPVVLAQNNSDDYSYRGFIKEYRNDSNKKYFLLKDFDETELTICLSDTECYEVSEKKYISYKSLLSSLLNLTLDEGSTFQLIQKNKVIEINPGVFIVEESKKIDSLKNETTIDGDNDLENIKTD